MDRKTLRKKVLQSSEGLLESTTDFVLHSLYYFSEVLDRPTVNTVLSRAEWAADKELSQFNYQTIKRAVKHLAEEGFTKNGVITLSGKKHLAKVLPSLGDNFARSKGEVFLVSYDVNETSRKGRDALRRWLKSNDAVLLQKSLFVVITAVSSDLESLVLNYKLQGEILIIKLTPNTCIGGKSIKEFLFDIYHLDRLEKSYNYFMDKFAGTGSKKISLTGLNFSYNLILKDEPNLPEEFLPDNWAGFKARSLYNKLVRRS